MEHIIENCDCIELLRNIDMQFDLSIIDPPYFRILKNEKCDKFNTYSEYIKWCSEWIELIGKRMRYSGTVLLYGCTRNFDILSDLNSLFRKNGFYFVEEIVIDKGMKSIAGRISPKIKMLPPVSENILVYRKDAKPFVKELLLSKQKEKGLTVKEIKQYLGMAANGGGNWTKYCGNTEFPLLPTKEHWLKIQELFDIDLAYFDIEEVYNGILGLTNVWNDIDFNARKKRTKHPSEKPLMLSERCIEIFSRPQDIVFVPFLGSGSELLACKNLNRVCIGSELDKCYFENYIKPLIEGE